MNLKISIRILIIILFINKVLFSQSSLVTGGITRDFWANVTGSSIADIPLDTIPTSTGEQGSFEGPSHIADNYGSRIRGYICPPTTGDYIFWIASDNQSELWLSTDDKPKNKAKIAYVTSYTGVREWTKNPSQQSVAINLTADSMYYIEAIHKEGTQGDNLAVGWQLPDSVQERPIPGSRLSPYDTFVYGQNIFAVIGDYGSAGPNEKAVADLVKSKNPEYIITTGDNNYPNGASSTIDANIGQYYHNYIRPYSGKYGSGADVNRFFPSLGNHDWVTPSATPYIQYFTLPGNERYYDFIKGSVHFFVIDSDPHEPNGTSSTSVQGTWLKNKLAASTSKWKIVYFHHSPYVSDVTHGSQEGMQWPFKTWGADAVISGHSHIYERIRRDGFPYFVVGLGGHSKYSIASTPVSGSLVRYNANYGAMFVTIKTDTLWFKFYNISNTLIDSYPLVKSLAGNDPPDVTITSPPNNYSHATPANVTITANATSNGGSITKVEFYQNNNKIGEDLTAPYSFTWMNVTTGNYALKAKATDNAGQTGISQIVNIFITGCVNATITPSGPTTMCAGSVTLNANTSPGSVYQWKKDGVNISGATNASYVASASGQYQVKIIQGSCITWSAPVTVKIQSGLRASITPGGPTTFCTGGNVKLYANTCSGYSYQWKKNGVNITGATAAIYTATNSGSYQLRVTQNGVNAWSAMLTVTVNSCATTGIDLSEEMNPTPLSTEAGTMNTFEMKVFPNPTTGLFTIVLVLPIAKEEKVKMRIVNMLGQEVLTKEFVIAGELIQETVELDQSLATGVYTLQVVIGTKVENINMVLSR